MRGGYIEDYEIGKVGPVFVLTAEYEELIALVERCGVA